MWPIVAGGGGLNALIAVRPRVNEQKGNLCSNCRDALPTSLIGCGGCLRRTEDAKKLTGLPKQKAGCCKVEGGGAGPFLSSYYTLCSLPKRHRGSDGGQSHHDGYGFPRSLCANAKTQMMKM